MPARIATVTLAVLLALAVWPVPIAAAASWRAPTAGGVTRPFAVSPDAFARGQHRGADFAAAPGAPVHAACTGRVVVADHIGTSGGVVTIACGRYRVNVLPLAHISARLGSHVAAGALLGTAGRSSAHKGIHLGVRRAGDPPGYVDPVRLIRAAPRIPRFGPVAAPRGSQERRGGPARPATPPATRLATPALTPARVRAAPRPASAAAPSRPLAPWPVWAGLGAALLAAAGSGVRLRGRWVRTRPRTTARAALAPAGATRDDLPP